MLRTDPVTDNTLGNKSIDELLLLIGDADKGAKTEALECIMDMGLDSCYSTLESAIRNNENADLRNGAMEAMVRFANKAVPRLTRLLNDKDEEVRNFSAVMLGDIANREAVGPLVLALRDQDPNVRHSAAEAIGKIGDRSALFPVLELLKEDFWIQYPAIVALGAMKDTRAIPYLLNILDDELVGVPAITALGEIGDPKVLFTLADIICDPSPLRSGAAAEAIVAIEHNRKEFLKYKHSLILFAQADMPLREIFPKEGQLHLQRFLTSSSSRPTKEAAITLLGWIGDITAIPLMINLLEEDRSFSEIVVASLGAMGGEVVAIIERVLGDSSQAVQAILLRTLRMYDWEPDRRLLLDFLDKGSSELIFEVLETIKARAFEEFLPKLTTLATTQSGSIQGLVLDALICYDHATIMELVINLSNSQNVSDRFTAAKLMKKVNKHEFAEKLILLLNDNDISVKREAIKAAGKGQYAAALPVLRQLLSDNPDEIGENIVTALAEFASEEHLPAILQMLGSYNAALDLAIIKACGRIGASFAGLKLVEYLKNSNNVSQHLLASAIVALGELQYKNEKEWGPISDFISGYLSHKENDIRRVSLTSYAKIAGATAWPIISPAFKDSHWSVRIAALQVAGKLGGDKAVVPLLEALHDPDILVKKNAVKLLGELQNIRAISSLVQLLLDQEIGHFAFDALHGFGRNCLPWLHRSIKSDYPVELREKVIDLIGIIGDRKSVESLLEAIEDASPSVRLAAIDSLVFCYDSVPLKKLAHVKKFDTHDDVRNKAELALQLLTTERYF